MALTPVANGTKIYASQHNALITALQDEDAGHAHTGETDGGKRISHSDLTDGAIDSLSDTHTHAQIDDHLDAAAGVHELNASAYVPGIVGSQVVFACGYATLDTPDVVHDQSTKTVVTGLTTVLGAVITIDVSAKSGGWEYTKELNVDLSPGSGSFIAGVYGGGTTTGLLFYWFAWGTKS